jgi:hypothetical protein
MVSVRELKEGPTVRLAPYGGLEFALRLALHVRVDLFPDGIRA